MTPKPNLVCPLCGAPNECVPARTGSFEGECWCRDISIDPAVLARIPAADRGESCLCKACAGSETQQRE